LSAFLDSELLVLREADLTALFDLLSFDLIAGFAAGAELLLD
jgi:hypothetical protein